MLRLGWVGTLVNTQHDDRDDVVGQGEIDIVHDQDLRIMEARLSVDIGLTRRFGVSLMFPFRVIETSIRYLDTSGSEVELVRPSIHHRNETVFGLADPMILGSASGSLATWRVTGRAGVTIPIGRTEKDPFVLGDMNLAHEHIQLGTGTVNPVVAIEAARSWGRWRFGAFALSQQVVYENRKGYHPGDRYAGGVAVLRRLGDRWSVRAGVDVQGETAERWNGVVHTDDGNRGRFDLILGAGASVSATKQVSFDLALKVPAVTHAVGGQLEMPALLELGASWSFGAPAAAGHVHGEDDHDDDHDHHHDHGDHDHDHDGTHAAEHPDTTGLDVADLGKPGEAVDLVPVPGKITIFDFWATWCGPCKVLEPALVEIARAHPYLVAIRRIDVVDWDSAAVARHLSPGAFSLPHLKIFDPASKKILERSSESGKLEALIKDVRALVEAEATRRTGGSAPPPTPVVLPAPMTTFLIIVTANGFEPNDVKVPVGRPVTLRFERRVEKICATEIVIELDGKKVVKDLPLNTPVELTVTFSKPGRVEYSCAMGMNHGSFTAQ